MKDDRTDKGTMYVVLRSKESHTVVVRWYVLVGLPLVLWAYLIMGGFVFNVLEGGHEKKFINETMNIYLEVLREYIILRY